MLRGDLGGVEGRRTIAAPRCRCCRRPRRSPRAAYGVWDGLDALLGELVPGPGRGRAARRSPPGWSSTRPRCGSLRVPEARQIRRLLVSRGRPVGKNRAMSPEETMDVEAQIECLNTALRLQHRSVLMYSVTAGQRDRARVPGPRRQDARSTRSPSSRTPPGWSRRSPRSAASRPPMSRRSSFQADPAHALDQLVDCEGETLEALQAAIEPTGREAASEAVEHRLEHMIMRKQEQVDYLLRARRRRPLAAGGDAQPAAAHGGAGGPPAAARARAAGPGRGDPPPHPAPGAAPARALRHARRAPGGLHARRRSRRRSALASVVKTTINRLTLHLVAGEDYPAYAQLTRQSRMRAWRKHYARPGRGARGRPSWATGCASRARTSRSATGSRRYEGVPGRAWAPIVFARTLLPLVQLPPGGHWDDRGRASFVIDPRPLPDPADAATLVLERYLGAFGPASRRDMAAWAGVAQRDFAEALARLPTVSYRDEHGTELLDLPGRPLPPESTPLAGAAARPLGSAAAGLRGPRADHPGRDQAAAADPERRPDRDRGRPRGRQLAARARTRARCG